MKQQNTPPRFFLWLFRLFCDPQLVEDIEGDLVERFELRQERQGRIKARWLLAKDTLQLFRPGIIRSFKGTQKLNYYDMFKHNLLISLRSFARHKSAFFINLTGLTSGLACALFIYLWVNDEKAVDKFHTLDKQLYQVMLNHEESGMLRTEQWTQVRLADALEADVPEIKIAVPGTPTEWFGTMPLTYGDKTVKAEGKFVGEDYLNIFTYPLIHGTAADALTKKEGIVISASLAENLFGSTAEAMGKMVKWSLLQFSQDYFIAGVFADLPTNSTDQFDFLMSFKVFKDMVGDGDTWGNYNAVAWVVLEENTDVVALNAKLGTYVKEKDQNSNVNLFLRRYSDQYLYGQYENGVQAGGRIEYVRLFSAIAVFILLIASINFMNLSTARATRRTKEIGVKKAIGARRSHLITQYLEESLLLTCISAFLALGLVWLLLPQFNSLTDKHITLLFDRNLLTMVTGIILVTGLVAGSYPALYLSGFKPVAILKGRIKGSVGELWARKGLVVFQFALSVTLIVGVLVVYKQIEYVQNTNLGYEKENVLMFKNEGKVNANMQSFMSRVENIPGVLSVAATSHPIVKQGGFTTGVSWPGEEPDVEVRFSNMTTGGNFIKTLGIELVAGRDFDPTKKSDYEGKIIFNETAIKTMGLEDPVGKTVKLWGNDVQIIGVVKDFHAQSLHEEISPLFIRLNASFLTDMVVRIAAGQERETLDRLTAFYTSYNEGFTFDYRFLDQDYAAQYVAEQRVSVLSRFFAGAAIIISCLGLFGLAAFTAERRSKEIGIRKALGATTAGIVQLLSGEFNRMVSLAILLAMPVSYYLIKSWLDGFAYKIDLNIWYFAGAGLAALLIAWLTVGLQTLKAARVNPSNSLRSE
jgi:ABC-type antimicrobial peptide transport system permease subunit